MLNGNETQEKVKELFDRYNGGEISYEYLCKKVVEEVKFLENNYIQLVEEQAGEDI